MTVSAPLPGFRAYSISPAASTQARNTHTDGNPQGQSFDGILASLGEPTGSAERPEKLHRSPQLVSVLGALEQGHEFLSGTQAYSLQVRIGDNALSFQARPIVGVTSVILPEGHPVPGDVSAVPVAGSLPHSSDTPAGKQGAADTIDREPVFVIAPADSRVSGHVASQPVRIPGQVQIRSSGHAPQPAPASLGVGRSVTDRTTAPIAEQVEAARPSRPDQPTARTMLFAQLLAATGEYRVAVRGTQLSQDDRDKLIMDIRAALRSLGFADLPISLSTPSGAT